MSLGDTLREVVETLQASGLKYMVTGSIAGAYHGTPRSTQDIDLVVDGDESQFLEFARVAATKDYYVSEEAVREAVRTRGQFNVIDRSGPWKVDLIVLKDREFSRVEFSRRRREEAFGYSLWMATAEDVVLAKLEWASRMSSERQLQDVMGVLRSQANELDWKYLEKWVGLLGVDVLWNRIRDEMQGPTG